MKKELVLEYLKEELRKLSSLEKRIHYEQVTRIKYLEHGPTLAFNYVCRLHTWYKQEQEVFASVTTIMDIFEYEYPYRFQHFIDDYLKGLRVRLSSL